MRSKFNITIPLDESMFEEPVMQILKSVIRDVAKEEALNAVKEAFTPTLEKSIKSSVASLVKQATYSNGEMSDKIKNLVAQTMNDVCFENTIKKHTEEYVHEWEKKAEEEKRNIENKMLDDYMEAVKPFIRKTLREILNCE